MKELVLAEKPSVASEIAKVLKCGNKNKGYFEGQKYVITWALGHLVTLAEPEDYDKKLKEWHMEDLPMLPGTMKTKVIRQTSHQFAIVRNLMRRSDISGLIIATDAGREGELVARWIMVQAGWSKPFKRLWISSQTEGAILDGFADLKPGRSYDNLYYAALCRAEADWLIGLNVTRALTCKYNAQLSAGRVQTPTLYMITQREKEIKNFVPVNYWTIRADFGDYFGDFRNASGNGRIFDYDSAQRIVSKVSGRSGRIIGVNTEQKTEMPPLAYDLTELQRDANRRYGFSAQKTLSVLQGLYERRKLVTYPRTDSRYISSDIVATLPSRLKGMSCGPYFEIAAPLLRKKLTPGKRFVDNNKVTDHHAIIPTEQPLRLSELDSDERNLYDLIARRFLAVLYPPCRREQVTIVTEAAGERFYSSGSSAKEYGWRAVTSKISEKDSDSDALPEQQLLAQHNGSIKDIRSCRINGSKTKPPSRYTDATLLTAMECAGKFIDNEELRESIKQGGLGTPATRAEIIEKLVSTSYIERHGKEFVPTSKGMQLINLVPENLKSPELTAEWELKLSGISQGREDRDEFISGIRKSAASLVDEISSDTATYRADNVSKTKCPLCGKFMLIVNGRHGRMLCCPDRACGYRQPEKRDEFGLRSSKKQTRINQRLISEFSDAGSIGNSLGDLLKAAMEEKKN